ncbi:DHCW motif cupin fold protein [Spirosoma arcticum]
MHTPSIPFQVTDWTEVPATEYPGESGTARWRTLKFGSLRVRLVDYSPRFLSDHWCKRGHIMFVVSGVLEIELADNQVFRLTQGMSFEVSDQESVHRTRTDAGATLFIVDGGFLAGESTSL